MNPLSLSPHVFTHEDWLFTRNLTPGVQVYTEKLIQVGNEEYRSWNPRKSKLCAGIFNGLQTFPFDTTTTVLYLGAASGTTASHISDICTRGLVYCVEFSPRTGRELVFTCESRKNMVPILADASQPHTYSDLITAVDIIYQDIAQPNQSDILRQNCPFLREGGFAYICIKSRSIDVTAEPSTIFKKELKAISQFLHVTERIPLEPWEKDHLMIVGRK